MTRKAPKVLAALAMGSLTLAFGGCLGSGVWQTVISEVALDSAYELFLGENDGMGLADLALDRFEIDEYRPEPVRSSLEPELDEFGNP